MIPIDSCYDVIIVGAGPAGYTAGIYLARFLLDTLILDTVAAYGIQYEPGMSRSETPGRYMNIPGFPEGISRHDLKTRGISQASNEGCDYRIGSVKTIAETDDCFMVFTQTDTFQAKTVILATGVKNDWKTLPKLAEVVGTSLFWSVELNGKEAQFKTAAVIGNDDLAVQEAVRLKGFADSVILLTNGGKLNCSSHDATIDMLSSLAIPVFYDPIEDIVISEGKIDQVILATGQVIPSDILFAPTVFQYPNNGLGVDLGAAIDAGGYLVVDGNYETTIPNVYAIGDVASRGQHQGVLSSYHQGIEVAYTLHNKSFRKTLSSAMKDGINLKSKEKLELTSS